MPKRRIRTTMTTTTISIEAQLRLACWLSPAFPTGAFAYSHGLEWAVEAGDVRNAAGLAFWLEDLLQHGALWTDAVLLRLSYDGSSVADRLRLAVLGAALAGSRERRLETLTQGAAFIASARPWATPALESLPEETPYPVAVGVLAASHGVPLALTLAFYLHAAAGNLVSAAVRLVPLGQSAGLDCVRTLEPVIAARAVASLRTTEDDLGGAAFRSDIASMRHETQYTRLFRT